MLGKQFMRRMVMAGGLILLFLQPTYAAVTKGPYLIYEGVNTEITVLWQLDTTQSCTVEWGLGDSYADRTDSTVEYGSDHQHKYTIANLTPGTHYSYQVYCDTDTVGNGSFTTAPADDADSVKFMVYGDTQAGPANQNMVTAQMINTYTNDPEFQSITLHTGDWVQNGDRESDWTSQIFDPYYTNIHEFQANMPLNGARGNHEDSGVLFEKYFPYPYEPDGMYWSFDYGPAHIAVIDEYTKLCPGYPQNAWLENDLANSTKKWKFILLHEPGWSVGQNNTWVQQCIQPLAVKYGVDIIFNGHNHCYAHAEVEGVHHVTTGGGGGSLFTPDPDAEYVLNTVQAHHFLELAIEGNNLFLTARDTDGYELDSFQLIKESTSFAVIGDFGADDADLDELDVANLVASWSPDYVITVGDNRYDPASMDTAVGKYYCDFLADAGFGTTYCNGGNATVNAFFPSLGNHDYTDGGGINEYLNYFTLPGVGIETSNTSGSEKYYDFIQGPIHFFVIDSDDSSSFAVQQTWLQEQLTASTAPWQVVYFHHAPYSSGRHGSTVAMRWPFAEWGADAVFAGHDHTYERLEVNGIPYFVNGLGGASRYSFDPALPESIFRYNSNYGAMLVDADEESITFQFINVAGTMIDSHTIQAGGTTPPPANDGIIDKRIMYSSDDVEQHLETGGMYMGSTDLEIGDDLENHGPQSVGLRFQGLNIPQGGTVTSAYIEFTVDETTSAVTDVQFQTQAADNAEPFTAAAFNLTDRPWNPSTVSWSIIPAWSSVGTKHQSPDLTVLVQEVVDRGGWSSGNSMVFLVSGTGERVAEAFDGAPAAAPLLHIEFDTDGSANAAPLVSFSFISTDLTVDFTDSSSDSDGTIISWSWDFGDGNTSSDQNPSHTYAAVGTYTVALTVTDDEGATDSVSTSLTVTAPDTEAPAITAPADVTMEATGETTVVNLGSPIVSDDLDPSPTVSNDAPAAFPLGTTTVTWTATDASGNSASATQTVTVTEPALQPFELTTSIYKVKGVRMVDLNWSGAASENVVIYRNGLVLTTTANDGVYADSVGKRPEPTYLYQVCEAGAATCSNEVVVNF